MRRFIWCGITAICGVLFLSCDLTGPGKNSFFNAPFYGLASGAVEGLSAAAADRRVSLAWNRAENAEYYEVYYGTTPEMRNLTPLKVTDTYAFISNLVNGVEYYLWVRAGSSLDRGPLLGPVRARPHAAEKPPEPPEAPRAAARSGMVMLDWLPVEGALSYDVWKWTSDNGAEAQKCAEDLEALIFTVEGLINETTYYFWISAKNAAGESGKSAASPATPSAAMAATAAPAAPVLTPGSGQLTVSWQSVPGAERYEVWLGTSGNSAAAVKYGSDIAGTSTVITELTNGTPYYVWLRAKNNAGTSALSLPANATPTAYDSPPSVPAAFAVNLGSGKVTLSWQGVPGALAYEVWYGQTNNSGAAAKYGEDISSSLTAAVTGLANGTPYWFWLKAKNNAGTSGFSPVAQAKPIADASAPALTVGNGQLSVTWTPMAGADQYELFYGTGINPPALAAYTVSVTSQSLTGLANGTTYSVWVRGKNSTGTGAASPAANAKPLGAMGTVTLAQGNQRIDASWPLVAGADKYEVFCDTGAVMPASPVQTVFAPALTASLTTLANGTVYNVWVKPLNSYGAGAASAMASAKPLGTPAAPTLTADNGKLTVSWAAVTGADSYDVFYNTSAAMPGTPVETGVNSPVTISGLANGTVYHVWVRGKNSTGPGAASPAATGTPTNRGLYKGSTFAEATKIGNQNLADSLSYITANVQTNDKYYIVLGADETLAPQTLSYSNKTVGITLMADGVERTVRPSTHNYLFGIGNGVTLTLENNVTLTGGTSYLVVIAGSGIFIMNGGEISGNTTSSGISASAGGVIVGGTFTMNGGKISGNSGSFSGGGVCVNGGGTFTMNDGEISGNTGQYAGGVYVSQHGTFIMNYGKISGNMNSASYPYHYAGGVYIEGHSTFTMNGGEISGNTASSYGGGVYIASPGTFTMNGGEISGNTASSYGGGVCVNGTFIKSSSGGVITGYGSDTVNGNKVVNSSGVVQSGKGHAVYVSSSQRLEKTVLANKALNSSVSGGPGGWTE